MDYFFKGLNVIGVLLTIWFALTSWIWTYWGALYISYPIGLIALLILLCSPSSFAKKPIKIILIIGVVTSAVALLSYR